LVVLSDTHEPGTVKVGYRGLHRFCAWLIEEGQGCGAKTQEMRPGVNALDLVLNHDPQIRLLWEMRCDCAAQGSPLIGAVSAYEEDRHLYLPSISAGMTILPGAKRLLPEGSARALPPKIGCIRSWG
jgi:hypothetical protein